MNMSTRSRCRPRRSARDKGKVTMKVAVPDRSGATPDCGLTPLCFPLTHSCSVWVQCEAPWCGRSHGEVDALTLPMKAILPSRRAKKAALMSSAERIGNPPRNFFCTTHMKHHH